jgi:starch phosphorylase
MKAALNGVPNFSVMDGWWIEGLIEGVTGWAIGNTEIKEDPAAEIADLYNKLETEIVPMFYKKPDRYIDIMRMSIALNGSFFNTQRMVQQYVTNAYLMRSDALPSVPRTPVKAGV